MEETMHNSPLPGQARVVSAYPKTGVEGPRSLHRFAPARQSVARAQDAWWDSWISLSSPPPGCPSPNNPRKSARKRTGSLAPGGTLAHGFQSLWAQEVQLGGQFFKGLGAPAPLDG